MHREKIFQVIFFVIWTNKNFKLAAIFSFFEKKKFTLYIYFHQSREQVLQTLPKLKVKNKELEKFNPSSYFSFLMLTVLKIGDNSKLN